MLVALEDANYEFKNVATPDEDDDGLEEVDWSGEDDEDFEDEMQDNDDMHEIRADDDLMEPDPDDDDHLPDDDLQ